ncbi:hypothetical protein [Streptosporangium roseum]|uniref:hypothetical protein n=1 Tax=Streptosporangium roseum TaxID=2001 RepID=UPI00331F7B57
MEAAFQQSRKRHASFYQSLIREHGPLNGHPIEVTEVKAPANRYEIGYSAELADDPSAVFTPEELADNGIALVI